MLLRLAIAVGRLVRLLARARGGGSAIPGRIALWIDPAFLEHTIGAMRGGVVFVTGSNGKSTTTAMLVALVRAHGMSVFTNPAGSNLPQGLASAVLADANAAGRLDADLAILEVDEAYGPVISQRLVADYLVVTNLQLDQLNRFGEPEKVWQMMRIVAERTREGLLVNDRESALLALGAHLDLITRTVSVGDEVLAAHPQGLIEATLGDERGDTTPTEAPTVTLTGSSGTSARVTSAGDDYELEMPADGLHWAVDATIALGMAQWLVGQLWSWDIARDAFQALPPVYGRGEAIDYRGRNYHLLMQKNLPSMRANLSVITTQPESVWIAVDEGTPDPSWIWDLDLSALSRVDVLSGTKAAQWATLLSYRGIEVERVIESTKDAMDFLSDQTGAGAVTAIVNYEQMMAIRRIAGRKDLESLS